MNPQSQIARTNKNAEKFLILVWMKWTYVVAHLGYQPSPEITKMLALPLTIEYKQKYNPFKVRFDPFKFRFYPWEVAKPWWLRWLAHSALCNTCKPGFKSHRCLFKHMDQMAQLPYWLPRGQQANLRNPLHASKGSTLGLKSRTDLYFTRGTKQ